MNDNKNAPEKIVDETVTLDLKFEPATDTIVLIRNSEIKITDSNIVVSHQTKKEYDDARSYDETEHYRVMAAGQNKMGYKHGDKVILRANADLEWFNHGGNFYYITHVYGIAGKITDELQV